MTCLRMLIIQGNWLHKGHNPIWSHSSTSYIVLFWWGQNTVESSTFGSESIALRIGTELLEGLQYTLRMMGIPIHMDPTTVWVDNESVVKNTSVPEATLKKKHIAICYHLVIEAAATGIIKIYHIRHQVWWQQRWFTNKEPRWKQAQRFCTKHSVLGHGLLFKRRWDILKTIIFFEFTQFPLYLTHVSIYLKHTHWVSILLLYVHLVTFTRCSESSESDYS